MGFENNTLAWVLMFLFFVCVFFLVSSTRPQHRMTVQQVNFQKTITIVGIILAIAAFVVAPESKNESDVVITKKYIVEIPERNEGNIHYDKQIKYYIETTEGSKEVGFGIYDKASEGMTLEELENG